MACRDASLNTPEFLLPVCTWNLPCPLSPDNADPTRHLHNVPVWCRPICGRTCSFLRYPCHRRTHYHKTRSQQTDDFCRARTYFWHDLRSTPDIPVCRPVQQNLCQPVPSGVHSMFHAFPDWSRRSHTIHIHHKDDTMRFDLDSGRYGLH